MQPDVPMDEAVARIVQSNELTPIAKIHELINRGWDGGRIAHALNMSVERRNSSIRIGGHDVSVAFDQQHDCDYGIGGDWV